MRAILTGTWDAIIVTRNVLRELARDLALDALRLWCRLTHRTWMPRMLKLDKEFELAMGNLRLASLFQTHGIDAQIVGWVVNTDDPVFCAHAEVVNEIWYLESVSRELQVHFAPAPGQQICERFIGVGNDRDAADKDAWLSFAGSMFHVLACVFFEQGCERVTRRHCNIDGLARLVTCGPPVFRGNADVIAAPMRGLLDHITSAMMQTTLTSGTHWGSLFCRRCDQRLTERECLLDQMDWPEMNGAIEDFSFPALDGCGSARLFLIVHDLR